MYKVIVYMQKRSRFSV